MSERETLFNCYLGIEPKILATAMRKVNGYALMDMEDFKQETRLAIWQRLEKTTPDSIFSLCMAIAINILRYQIRLKGYRRNQAQETQPRPFNPARRGLQGLTPIELSILLSDVESAFNALTIRERESIIEWLDDKNKSTSINRCAIHRAKKRLRGIVG